MNILKADLICNHQVPCSDGTYHNTYDIRVIVKVKNEELSFFYTLDEKSSMWGHSLPYDQSGDVRPALLTKEDFHKLFSDPKVRVHVKEVNRLIGLEGESTLETLPDEAFSTYDFVDFHNLCKKIARNLRVKFQILTYDDLDMCSYNAVKLDLKDGTIYILCNDYNIAFTEEIGGYPRFTYHQELASFFAPPYKVCTIEQLNSPFRIHRPLSKWEEYSIKHWKPQTQGEFLFNYWD
ncbi:MULTISPECIES: hypothetical protein [Bacillus]|uniref:hypothetical protein n=1 Tax=Bacillus TaxID=1386 RepID=UPI000BB8568D|nr:MULTISPECIES: hypothetical protein [Bacillus]